MLRVASTLLIIGLSGASYATPRLPESGLYEGFDPRDGLPAGPIILALGAPDPELYPSWLEVERRLRPYATTYAVTFMPAGRVRWDMEVDAFGLAKKITTVDGEALHTSEFTCDFEGRPTEKRVVFAPGEVHIWHFGYDRARRDRIDEATGQVDQSLVTTRRGAFEMQVPARDRHGERLERFDAEGRRLELVLESERDRASVSFVRAPNGQLKRLARHATPQRHDDLSRNPTFAPLDLAPAETSRADVWRLFGAPRQTSDSGRGATREVRDNWAAECWLNRTNALVYSADEAVTDYDTNCICGLCVAVESQPYGIEIEGVDTHLSEGPWVLIDGVLMTAGAFAHRVATPDGSVPADLLRVGDVVLDANGRPRPVASVVFLGYDLRPAVNLRTRSGTFIAGDLTVMSEPLLGCPGVTVDSADTRRE